MQHGSDLPASQAQHQPPGARAGRRKDLDRLRVLACLSTFIYHPLTVFDHGAHSHIKSATTSAAFDIASRLLHVVRMPLFFLIAGMVGYLSLRGLGNREILRLRARRLLLPFLVGVVLIAPAIKYLELLDGRHINYRGVVAISTPPEPLVFLRRFFTQLQWFSWSHLWFLVYLYLLGALLLPPMRALSRAQWGAAQPAPLGLAIPLVLLIAVEVVLRPLYPAHLPNLIGDWASVSVYVICMLAGAALVRFPELERPLQRGVPVLLVAFAAGVACYLTGGGGWVMGLGRALLLWAALALLLGLGPWLGRGRLAGESYLAEAVLPLYVLHLLPLVAIAYVVKDMPWPLWARYGVIVAGGGAITFAVYHWLVRPYEPMRAALGLPPGRPPP